MIGSMDARFVRVYGGDHSPWVNAVLLGLHLKQIPHDVITFPPLLVFLRSGILMPVAHIDDGPWLQDSTAILSELGYTGGSADQLRGTNAALRGGTNRTDSAWQFWYRWSLVREPAGGLVARILRSALRGFTVMYFYLTLKRFCRQYGHSPVDRMQSAWLRWNSRLKQSDGPFLGGREPNMADLQLFGAVQCHCSIPVPTVDVLRNDPKLERVREWIGAMQRLCVDYQHLYSGIFFDPALPEPRPSPIAERSSFWVGSVVTVLVFPITLPLWYFYMRHVRTSGKLGIPSMQPGAQRRS